MDSIIADYFILPQSTLIQTSGVKEPELPVVLRETNDEAIPICTVIASMPEFSFCPIDVV